MASSTTDFIQTEQWLHYYDIFVRNGFGSYLRVMRKVTFNSTMSDWLNHRDSSSVEYNARSPNENIVHEITEVFVLGLTTMNLTAAQGRHFWNLHPLCSENSLTFHGAEYVFVGVADVSGSLTLDADSAFFAAICDGGSECTNATSVVRNQTLPCTS